MYARFREHPVLGMDIPETRQEKTRLTHDFSSWQCNAVTSSSFVVHPRDPRKGLLVLLWWLPNLAGRVPTCKVCICHGLFVPLMGRALHGLRYAKAPRNSLKSLTEVSPRLRLKLDYFASRSVIDAGVAWSGRLEKDQGEKRKGSRFLIRAFLVSKNGNGDDGDGSCIARKWNECQSCFTPRNSFGNKPQHKQGCSLAVSMLKVGWQTGASEKPANPEKGLFDEVIRLPRRIDILVQPLSVKGVS
jgi:hypothetical protein